MGVVDSRAVLQPVSDRGHQDVAGFGAQQSRASLQVTAERLGNGAAGLEDELPAGCCLIGRPG